MDRVVSVAAAAWYSLVVVCAVDRDTNAHTDARRGCSKSTREATHVVNTCPFSDCGHEHRVSGFGQIPGESDIQWSYTTLFQSRSSNASPTPRVPELNERRYVQGGLVIRVAAGPSHCVAWTFDGMALAWGNNVHGQCGVGVSGLFAVCDENNDNVVDHADDICEHSVGNLNDADTHVNAVGSTLRSMSPIEIPCRSLMLIPLENVKVTTVACGFWHTILLGDVISPKGEAGNTGNGSDCRRKNFKDVDVPHMKGVVLTCGRGDYYQLGLSEADIEGLPRSGSPVEAAFCRLSTFSPRRVSALHGTVIVSVAAGSRHSVACTAGGVVVSWGWNEWGQVSSMGGSGFARHCIESTCPHGDASNVRLAGVSCDPWSTFVWCRSCTLCHTTHEPT